MRRIFDPLFIILILLLSLCTQCSPTRVVVSDIKSNEVSRSYENMTREEVIKKLKEYDTAVPEVYVTPSGNGTFVIHASLGDRKWSREVVIQPDEPMISESGSKRKTVIITVVIIIIIIALISFLIFIFYRRKNGSRKQGL